MAQLPYLSSKYQDAYHKFSIVINGKDIQKESQENICIKSIKGNFEVPSLGLATSELLLRNGFDKESVKVRILYDYKLFFRKLKKSPKKFMKA